MMEKFKKKNLIIETEQNKYNTDMTYKCYNTLEHFTGYIKL